MGTYLNEGKALYEISVNSEIHVDKSLLIRELNRLVKTDGRYLCVSRPRRFGKSMAAHMLMAYYSRGAVSRELFKDKKIYSDPSFERHFGKYNVIHLTMTDFASGGIDEMITDVLSTLKQDIREEIVELRKSNVELSDKPFDFSKPDDLPRVLLDFFKWSGISYIFIIDEWDCLMRETKDDSASQKKYLEFLKTLLKDKAYVALAYMTGILPVKKYGQQSALNMFTEYSMQDQMNLAEFTGFTKEETRALCEKYGVDYSETERWYDGYDVNGIQVFNPRSIVQVCQHKRFANYWTKTETFESLQGYIMLDRDGLRGMVEKLIAGEKLVIDCDSFQNDMVTFTCADDVLTLLLHLGYLTYDTDTKECWIPNAEVAEEFVRSIRHVASWTPVMNAINDAENCLKAILAGDGETVASLIERCHQENTSIIRYNDENSLACVVTLALYTAKRKYKIVRELLSGKGYADIAFLPRRGENVPAIIVELKAEESPSIAIDQIKRREYPAALEGLAGEILLVGVNYRTDPADPDYKHHVCKIEKWTV